MGFRIWNFPIWASALTPSILVAQGKIEEVDFSSIEHFGPTGLFSYSWIKHMLSRLVKGLASLLYCYTGIQRAAYENINKSLDGSKKHRPKYINAGPYVSFDSSILVSHLLITYYSNFQTKTLYLSSLNLSF